MHYIISCDIAKNQTLQKRVPNAQKLEVYHSGGSSKITGCLKLAMAMELLMAIPDSWDSIQSTPSIH